MPAKSEAQRRLMAMALHNPEKVNKENRGVLKMSHTQLREFSHKRGTGGSGSSPVKFLKREGGTKLDKGGNYGDL